MTPPPARIGLTEAQHNAKRLKMAKLEGITFQHRQIPHAYQQHEKNNRYNIENENTII